MENKEIIIGINDIDGMSFKKMYNISKLTLEEMLKNFTEEALRIEKYRRSLQKDGK